MRVVEAVAPFVLVGQRTERPRPHILRALGVTSDPSGRTHVVSSEITRHGAFKLGAEDQRDVVAPRLEIGHGGEQRDAAGRTRCLVPRGRFPGKRGFHGGRHGSEMTLSGEQLPEGIADMDNSNVRGVDLRRFQCSRHDFAEHRGEVPALLGPVAREVRLIPAQNPDHHLSLRATPQRLG